MTNESPVDSANSAIEAAAALRYLMKSGGHLMEMVSVKTAAYGFAETALTVRYELGARQAASRISKAAREADRKVLALYQLYGLPTEYTRHEFCIPWLWGAWRDLWRDARSVPVAMLLVAFSIAQQLRHELRSGPQLVSLGGTPERIAAHNLRELQEHRRKSDEANASVAVVMRKLEAVGASHLLKNGDVICAARCAAEAFYELLNDYCQASMKPVC